MRGQKPKLDNVVPMKADQTAPVPEAPDWMSAEGRDVWDRLAPVLVAKRRLDPAYEDPFAMYCESVADVIRFTGDIAAFGSWYEVETRNGRQQKKRAVWGQRQDAIATMNQLAARFGMTPVDEARMSAGGQGDLFGEILRTLDGTD
ncbi:phage terminase small subunit P27 family [Rhodovulum sp. BSW8]|uniref:P27 family phage terminase small subunit n=1 Tax=Rhodovulum sp. BSW8 TaxID=2259645 RepID=UPI000DE2D8E4|nr:P27 family phage terminase small subunit [Rhodovulum sp. BSW8]RBO51942.1 phage terminase small subunit P27 family [Rhodovulum sp. BSW8]